MMDGYDSALDSKRSSTTASTFFLFLGLYLLVLAFFILLVSFSTLEDVKAKTAMKSLTATFSTVLPSTDPTALQSEDSSASGQAFQEQVTGIFATSLQVAKVEIVQPGRLMRVIVPTDALFRPGTDNIRRAQTALLDRIIATLSGRPPGMRHDMELVLGGRFVKDKDLSTERNMELRRADAFVREMLSRGVPPDSVTVGVKPGNPDMIIMWFYVRNIDELRKNLKHLRPHTEQE
ncbi:MAG: hypothetical protein WD407_09115 [Rhodospirillales bacterium]